MPRKYVKHRVTVEYTTRLTYEVMLDPKNALIHAMDLEADGKLQELEPVDLVHGDGEVERVETMDGTPCGIPLSAIFGAS